MIKYAVEIQNLSKIYRLYDNQVDRLKESFHPFRKKYHRDFYALKNVDLCVTKGQSVGFIGKNGSGKSTLLQIMAGVLTPTEGMVKVDGRILALLELGTGFNPELTGIENIYFNGSLMGATKEELDIKIDRIIAFADIGEFIYQPVKTYSSGMYVRLAFAVVANLGAEILIIDEALAVGDAVYVQKCMRFIRQFRKTGTVFFVSHDTQAVLDLCDRAVWIDGGVVKLDGNSRDVVREYNAYIHGLIISDNSIHVSKSESREYSDDIDQFKDHRKQMLTDSTHRNFFELFDFDFDSPWWGKGDADLLDVRLFNSNGDQTCIIEGAELIELSLYCQTKVELRNPVVGFSLRNHRGLELISENTYLTYKDSSPPVILPGEKFKATFKFRLPYLRPGDYTFGGAIADGVPGEHIQHHRRDEALHFKVHASHVVHGLFGMPILQCSIDKLDH